MSHPISPVAAMCSHGLCSFSSSPLAARAAQGGTYQVVSITGGQGSYVSYPSGQTYTLGVTHVNGLRTAPGRFEASQLQLSGPLTATFKWVPDDPSDPFDVSPSSVLFTENTSVFVGIAVLNPPGPKTSTYTIDDGIDPAQSGTCVSLGKQLSGSRATPKSGATITVTCSPGLSISTADGAANDYVSIDYSVDPVYPTLGFSGPTTDPSTGRGMAAPVGQGINSGVSTRSVFSAVGTVTDARWSVSNGDACASFNVTSDSQGNNVYKNRDPGDGGGGDPGGPTSPGNPGSPGGGTRPEMRSKRGGKR